LARRPDVDGSPRTVVTLQLGELCDMDICVPQAGELDNLRIVRRPV
jgi:hypothetical protein